VSCFWWAWLTIVTAPQLAQHSWSRCIAAPHREHGGGPSAGGGSVFGPADAMLPPMMTAQLIN
jgi:hypothetical protein